MIDLDKCVPFSIISMNFILFIFLYLKNTGKTTIVTSIKVIVMCKHPQPRKWVLVAGFFFQHVIC